VGSSPEANYLAFGDDSQSGDTLVYAFVIARRTRIRAVEARITALKDRFKIPKHTTLHCRILFSGHQRQKAGLGHLTPEDVQSIVARSITIMNQSSVLVRYPIADLVEFGDSLSNEIEMQHESDGSTIKLPVQLDPKGILGMLMQSCFAVPLDGSHGPSASDCRIFVSEDSTKVEFIGERRRRADALYSGYSDVGAPPGNVFQLQPSVVKADSEPILQLADIAAYVCSHAHDATAEGRFFGEQLSRFRYWSRSVLAANPALQGTRAEAARPDAGR
jgi:Protein of unknown function (DUF3800)